MIVFSVGRIRELKGAPLSVFILLNLVTVPVNQAWLERQSGYTDKPVSQALLYLQEAGWIVKTASGWHVASGAQLALGQSQLIDDDPVSRNNSDSGPIIIINNDYIEHKDESKNKSETRKNSDSEHDPIWNELRRAGVYRNHRTEKMIELPHVNLEYVQALAEQMRAEGKGGCQWAGLFVQLCERGEPVNHIETVQEKIDQFMNRGNRR